MHGLVPRLLPFLHHLLHLLHLISIAHPLLHHRVVLLFAQFSLPVQNVFKKRLLLHFWNLLVLNLPQQVVIASLCFDGAKFLNFLGVFHELVVLKRVCTIVELIKEFEKFGISMLWVRRIGQHIDHILGDVKNIFVCLFGFFLHLFNLLLSLLDHLWLRLVHPWTHAHATHHPWLHKLAHLLLLGSLRHHL